MTAKRDSGGQAAVGNRAVVKLIRTKVIRRGSPRSSGRRAGSRSTTHSRAACSSRLLVAGRVRPDVLFDKGVSGSSPERTPRPTRRGADNVGKEGSGTDC